MNKIITKTNISFDMENKLQGIYNQIRGIAIINSADTHKYLLRLARRNNNFAKLKFKDKKAIIDSLLDELAIERDEMVDFYFNRNDKKK